MPLVAARPCYPEFMPKPNYSFQKRQRELAKKAKKEAKKRDKEAANAADTAPPPAPDAETGAKDPAA